MLNECFNNPCCWDFLLVKRLVMSKLKWICLLCNNQLYTKKKDKEMFLRAACSYNIMLSLSKVKLPMKAFSFPLLWMLKCFSAWGRLERREKNQYHTHTNVCLHEILTTVMLVVLHEELKAISIVQKGLIVIRCVPYPHAWCWKRNNRTNGKAGLSSYFLTGTNKSRQLQRLFYKQWMCGSQLILCTSRRGLNQLDTATAICTHLEANWKISVPCSHLSSPAKHTISILAKAVDHVICSYQF